MTPQLLFKEAVSLHQQGKLEEAERLYLQVMAAAPENFPTRYMFAQLCFQQKRNAEALEAVEKALTLNRRSADALTLHGVLLHGLGRSQDALAEFDAAVAEKPDDASRWYNRGFVLISLGRLAESLLALDRAVMLNPRHADAWHRRGVVRFPS